MPEGSYEQDSSRVHLTQYGDPGLHFRERTVERHSMRRIWPPWSCTWCACNSKVITDPGSTHRPSVIASQPLNVDKALLVRDSGSSCTSRAPLYRAEMHASDLPYLLRNLYGYKVRALSTFKTVRLSWIQRVGSVAARL